MVSLASLGGGMACAGSGKERRFRRKKGRKEGKKVVYELIFWYLVVVVNYLHELSHAQAKPSQAQSGQCNTRKVR